MKLKTPHGVVVAIALAVQSLSVARAADNAEEFSLDIRPVLAEHCIMCHNPADPGNRHDFLKSESATDVETRRTLWRSVATQLRNRTMPPGDAKLSEPDRLLVADWIETRLRTTGCTGDKYAGYVAPRRLNRREYRNTVRDLFGVELPIADLFAADESGGAGFDTNGETLYLPPMMIERYMDAAQEVVDRLIVTPPLSRVFLSHELAPSSPRSPKRRETGPEAESRGAVEHGDHGVLRGPLRFARFG